MSYLEKHPFVMIVIGVMGISLSAIFVRYSQAPSSVTAAYRLLWTVLLPVYARTSEPERGAGDRDGAVGKCLYCTDGFFCGRRSFVRRYLISSFGSCGGGLYASRQTGPQHCFHYDLYLYRIWLLRGGFSHSLGHTRSAVDRIWIQRCGRGDSVGSIFNHTRTQHFQLVPEIFLTGICVCFEIMRTGDCCRDSSAAVS